MKYKILINNKNNSIIIVIMCHIAIWYKLYDTCIIILYMDIINWVYLYEKIIDTGDQKCNNIINICFILLIIHFNLTIVNIFIYCIG